MAKVSAVSSFNEKEWRSKQDLETILEAERIKRDPARMKEVRKIAKARKEELVNDLGAFSEVEESEE